MSTAKQSNIEASEVPSNTSVPDNSKIGSYATGAVAISDQPAAHTDIDTSVPSSQKGELGMIILKICQVQFVQIIPHSNLYS